MIDLIVSLNGEDFEVRAQGDVYNGDLPDFNAAVRTALHAHFLKHPLHPLESAGLEVAVRRVHTDLAAHDGEGVFDANDPEDPALQEREAEEQGRESEAAEASENPDDLSDEELDARTAPDREDRDAEGDFLADDDRGGRVANVDGDSRVERDAAQERDED